MGMIDFDRDGGSPFLRSGRSRGPASSPGAGPNPLRRRGNGPEWTQERSDLLIRLWQAGVSARQVALQIGVTKSAVMGRLHRLGVKRGELGTAEARKAAREATQARAAERESARQRALASARVAAKAAAEQAMTLRCAALADLWSRPGGVRLEDVRAGQCRWPLADVPDGVAVRFCGDDVAKGAYCATHHAVAYRPASPQEIKDGKRARGLS